jgi:hypothetical protein
MFVAVSKEIHPIILLLFHHLESFVARARHVESPQAAPLFALDAGTHASLANAADLWCS